LDDITPQESDMAKRPADSRYKGTEKFTRPQLVFVVDCILIGALDRFDSTLPDNIDWDERKKYAGAGDPLALTDYERGGLETAGMALGVLFAQLTGEGLGIYDALAEAGKFHNACETLVAKAWADEGREAKARLKKHGRPGKAFSLADDIYTGYYPDTRRHAEQFVDSVFDDYLEGQ
jgi:hypothetical protein